MPLRYGFEADAAVIDFMGDVDGVEVEWTLGALLNELMLEAKEKARYLPSISPSSPLNRPSIAPQSPPDLA